MSTTLSSLASGVLDKLLARASARVDAFTNRRIQAPGSTTLSTGASAGDSSISVASTLNLDNNSEQAAVIGTGSTQETVVISPGGVSVSSYTSPYPGTIALATGLQYAHSSGASVQYCYQEVDVARAVSSNDSSLALDELFPYIGMYPPRVCFMRNYPIISVIEVEQANMLTNAYSAVDTSQIFINQREGWYRFLVWPTIIPMELLRTTYAGGFVNIPDDIKMAVSYYLAEEVQQYSNPFGLIELQEGKTRRRWGTLTGKSQLSQQAEEILCTYRVAI